MRLILIAGVVVLAACTTTPSFTAPTWTRQSVPTLPKERLHVHRGVAGWDGGFVVAGGFFAFRQNPDDGYDEIPVLHFSADDGQTWRQMQIPGVQSFVPGASAAGYGDHGYVLGKNDLEGPVLLTFEQDHWARLSLPDANSRDDAMAIVAGPRGVVIIALSASQSFKPKPAKIWYSSNGRTFSPPGAVSEELDTWNDVLSLVATENGFLVAVNMGNHRMKLFESTNGRDWKAVGGEFPQPQNPDGYITEIRALQRNGDVTVAFGKVDDGNAPDESPALAGWYRRDGETTWTSIELDPGRLPDPGVVPASRRDVHRVVRWQGGFLAFGNTGQITATWASPDGVSWHKIPRRENDDSEVPGGTFVTNGRTTLLVGGGSSKDVGPSEIWRANP